MPSPRTPAHDLRVVPHRPDRGPAALAVALTLVCLVGLCGYWLGGHQARVAHEEAQVEIGALAEAYGRLRADNERLAAALGDERLARQSGGVFSSQVRDTLSQQQATIGELEEQIRFYSSLMAGADEAGLQIADLELLERLDGGGVRFRLLLVQAAGRRDEAVGHVELRVVGERAGRAEVLVGSAVGTEDALPFRFMYFQRIAGEIRLPEGFEPRGVEVVARTGAEGPEAHTRTFSWELQEV